MISTASDGRRSNSEHSRAIRHILSAVAVLLAASNAAQAYTPEQQQLCTSDAFRLCGSDIPDEARITACMMRQRSSLSPGCRALFNTPAPVAERAARPAKPVSLQSAPKAARKKTKVRKPVPVT